MSDSTMNKLQGVFDSVFMDPVKITRGTSAADVEEWDSLLHISLVAMVESEFQVRFGVGEVEATKTVGEFADLIERHRRQALASA